MLTAHEGGFGRNVAAIAEQPWKLVEQLSDDLPFLLLPVRIETRFMSVESGSELWVRIFPDDIAVHTHEPDLTAAELSDGQVFWREMWAAARRIRRGPTGVRDWRVDGGLASYGSPRAAWIATQTAPAALDVPSADDLSFPASAPTRSTPRAGAGRRAPT